jgi:YHS domain-containing protein
MTHHGHHDHDDDPHATIDTPGATHDPVCNHWVIPEKAHGSSTYQGVTIHFCGAGCKRAFDKTPERFFPRYQAR